MIRSVPVVAALFLLLPVSAAVAAQETWHFDNLKRIGGHAVIVEGHPTIVRGPTGRAIQLAGSESVLIDGRPLIGAHTFTAEVLVRPDDGPFEQRLMHIAETDATTGQDSAPAGSTDHNARMMFEVRVKDGRWALDTFVSSPAGNRPLLFLDRTFPLAGWHMIAQSYDGTTYRSYVDGVLQGEGPVSFQPAGPGRVRVGARMNLVDHFHGAVALARFTDRALSPSQLLRVPAARQR
jgi:hypothetical protein